MVRFVVRDSFAETKWSTKMTKKNDKEYFNNYPLESGFNQWFAN